MFLGLRYYFTAQTNTQFNSVMGKIDVQQCCFGQITKWKIWHAHKQASVAGNGLKWYHCIKHPHLENKPQIQTVGSGSPVSTEQGRCTLTISSDYIRKRKWTNVCVNEDQFTLISLNSHAHTVIDVLDKHLHNTNDFCWHISRINKQTNNTLHNVFHKVSIS